jgi:hypothetical protein
LKGNKTVRRTAVLTTASSIQGQDFGMNGLVGYPSIPIGKLPDSPAARLSKPPLILRRCGMGVEFAC